MFTGTHVHVIARRRFLHGDHVIGEVILEDPRIIPTHWIPLTEIRNHSKFTTPLRIGFMMHDGAIMPQPPPTRALEQLNAAASFVETRLFQLLITVLIGPYDKVARRVISRDPRNPSLYQPTCRDHAYYTRSHWLTRRHDKTALSPRINPEKTCRGPCLFEFQRLVNSLANGTQRHARILRTT